MAGCQCPPPPPGKGMFRARQGAKLLREVMGGGGLPPSTLAAGFGRISVDVAAARQAAGGSPIYSPPPPPLLPPPLRDAVAEEAALALADGELQNAVGNDPPPRHHKHRERAQRGAPCKLCVTRTKHPRARCAGGKAGCGTPAPGTTRDTLYWCETLGGGGGGGGCTAAHTVWGGSSLSPRPWDPPPRGNLAQRRIGVSRLGIFPFHPPKALMRVARAPRGHQISARPL